MSSPMTPMVNPAIDLKEDEEKGDREISGGNENHHQQRPNRNQSHQSHNQQPAMPPLSISQQQLTRDEKGEEIGQSYAQKMKTNGEGKTTSSSSSSQSSSFLRPQPLLSQGQGIFTSSSGAKTGSTAAAPAAIRSWAIVAKGRRSTAVGANAAAFENQTKGIEDQTAASTTTTTTTTTTATAARATRHGNHQHKSSSSSSSSSSSFSSSSIYDEYAKGCFRFIGTP